VNRINIPNDVHTWTIESPGNV